MRISDWSSDVCSSDLSPCEGEVQVRIDQNRRIQFNALDRFIRRVDADSSIRRRIRRGLVDPGAHDIEKLQRILVLAQESRKIKTPANRTNRPVGLRAARSEEHTYELQSLMRISYAVFCW